MRYVPIAALALATLAAAAPASALPAAAPGGAIRQEAGTPDTALVQKAHSARWYRAFRIYGPPAAWRARPSAGPGYGYGPRHGYGPSPGYGPGYGRPYGEGPRYGGPRYGGW